MRHPCPHNWTQCPQGYPQTGDSQTGAIFHRGKSNVMVSQSPIIFWSSCMSSTKTTREDIHVLMILLPKGILKIRDRNKDYFSKQKKRQEGKMNIYVGIRASKPSLSTWYRCTKCNTLVQVEPCSVNLSGESTSKIWILHVSFLQDEFSFYIGLASLNTRKEFILILSPKRLRVREFYI